MRKLFRKNNFIDHSINGVLTFFKDSVLSEEHASAAGFLQSIDPRIKAFTFLLLCVATLFMQNLRPLLYLYLFCLLLVYVSKINLGFFIKRTWFFIPLFSFFIVIPALFSFVSPGEVLGSLNLFGLKLEITQPGLSSALLFLTRVTVSVSFVILLSLTTRHTVLLRVLRIFKVPQIFVKVLGMSYRYIYLFMETLEHTYLGIKSRTGGLIPDKKGRSIVAWNIATLWQRSVKLNEDVYSSMLSRGYTGEPIVLDEFKSTLKDWLWCILIVTVVLALYVNHG